MGLPIGSIIKGAITLVNKVVGGAGAGKMTPVGVIVATIGGAITASTGQNPFESARVIIDLCEKAWPHVLIIAGSITAVVGWVRRQGYNHYPTPTPTETQN